MNINDNILGQEIELDSSYNHSIKDAIIACAREEVRNLLREITSPNQVTSQSTISQYDKLSNTSRPESARQHDGVGRRKSAHRNRRYSSCHPRPASANNYCDVLSARTNNVYIPDHRKDLSSRKDQRRGNKVQLTSIADIDQSDFVSKTQISQMSFASSKWIQNSARIIIGDDEIKKKEMLKKLDYKANDYENKVNRNANLNSSKSFRNEKKIKIKGEPRKRPQTATGVAHRLLHKPTSALERRTSSNRPSTAHMVRAKAEEFSESLLHPIRNLETTSASPKPLPSVLSENEWENELARHIVSVFNNKIVSEVRNGEGNIIKREPFASNGERNKLHPSLEGIHSGKRCRERNDTHVCNRPETASSYKKKVDPLKESKKLIDSTRPRMIWITGTGNFLTDWNALESFTHFENGANNTLQKLASQGKYFKYADIVKASLCSSSPLSESTIPSTYQTKESLWRQLILIVNSFAIKLIQQRKYPQAIDLLDLNKNLLSYLDAHASKNTIDELTGFIKNSLAYYYSRRDKPSAALKYIIEAVTIQRKRKDIINVVKCNLHRAYILQQLNRYCEAIKILKVILKMVDDGSLELLNTSNDDIGKNNATSDEHDPQVVLLISVTYHNLCCLQLLKGQIGDACMNSQNCRRLCRLCMNVSNRYVNHFEETHMKAMNELFGIVCPKQTKKEAIVFQRLFSQLFSKAL